MSGKDEIDALVWRFCCGDEAESKAAEVELERRAYAGNGAVQRVAGALNYGRWLDGQISRADFDRNMTELFQVAVATGTLADLFYIKPGTNALAAVHVHAEYVALLDLVADFDENVAAALPGLADILSPATLSLARRFNARSSNAPAPPPPLTYTHAVPAEWLIPPSRWERVCWWFSDRLLGVKLHWWTVQDWFAVRFSKGGF